MNLKDSNSETVLIGGYSVIPESVWLPVEWTRVSLTSAETWQVIILIHIRDTEVWIFMSLGIWGPVDWQIVNVSHSSMGH